MRLFRRKNYSPNEIAERLKGKVHSIGVGCWIEKCDFGNDLELISIGNNVHIGKNSRLITYRPVAQHLDKILNKETNSKLRDLGPIIIMDDVYIGENVIIYPGTKICRGAVVLDGSVVIEDVFEGDVVVGNPAKPISTSVEMYKMIKEVNLAWPWFNKNINHEEIVKERVKYFFEERKE